MRRDFVANVSHELRSPLSSIRGFLEAMEDGTIPTDEHENISKSFLTRPVGCPEWSMICLILPE